MGVVGNGVSPISSPRTQEPGVLLSEGREKMNVPAQPESKLALFLSLFFHSGPQRSGGSSPELVSVSSLLRILIQMLTSCRNNFTDTSRNKQLHRHRFLRQTSKKGSCIFFLKLWLEKWDFLSIAKGKYTAFLKGCEIPVCYFL